MQVFETKECNSIPELYIIKKIIPRKAEDNSVQSIVILSSRSSTPFPAIAQSILAVEGIGSSNEVVRKR